MSEEFQSSEAQRQRELAMACGLQPAGKLVLRPDLIRATALAMEALSGTLGGLRKALDEHLQQHCELAEVEAFLVDSQLRLQADATSVRQMLERVADGLVLPADADAMRQMRAGLNLLTCATAAIALSLEPQRT